MRHAEVARDVLAGIAPFWWPMATTGAPSEARRPPTMALSSRRPVAAAPPSPRGAVPRNRGCAGASDAARSGRAARRQAPVDLLLEPSEAVPRRAISSREPWGSRPPGAGRGGSRSRSAASRNQARPAYSTSILLPARERLDFCHHGGAGIDEQLHPHHDLLIRQEHVHEERRAAPGGPDTPTGGTRAAHRPHRPRRASGPDT